MCAAPRIDNLNSYTNIVLNGNFDFWQRNTSFAAVANDTYTADRWQHSKTGSMFATISRSTDVPTVAQSGFASQYSLLYTVTTAQASLAAGDHVRLGYKVEGFDYASIASGQPIRVQFWVRSSVAGAYSVAFRNGSANRAYVTTITINNANTWERKVIDLTTDTSGTWALDNTNGLSMSICLGSGTTFQTGSLNTWQSNNVFAASSQTNLQATNGATFQIAQVMLVKGSFAAATSLTFQRAGKTIQGELAACQRYCFKSSSNFAGTAQAVASNQVLFVINFPTPMRSFPGEFAYTGFNVINATNGVGLSAITWTLSAETATPNPLVGRLVGTGTGTVVAGNASIVYSTNTGVDYFLLGAEL
jgi:hypothetical protein